MQLGEDLLLCDLAETYGIYDMYAFKPSYISTLVDGLRPTSRIKSKLTGIAASEESILLAYIADKTSNLVWMLSKDGHEGKNPPKSVLKMILGQKDEEQDKGYVTYDSPEEFDQAMKRYERR